jgi:hypothetical protein
MDEKQRESNADPRDAEIQARRTFLKQVGKASAMAPAVALLLAAQMKTAKAGDQYGGGSGSGSS